MEPRRRRRAVRLTTLGLVGVVVVGAAALTGVWVLQARLVYHPDRTAPPPAGQVIAGAQDITLTTDDGLHLHAWFIPPTSNARDQAVLVAPGNSGNRLGRAGFGRELAERGFAVLLMDYRGFGGNPGSPSEAGLLLDAHAAQRALADRGYPPERTIYFGESIGTGVVSGLQAEVPPAGIVLRSPFTSLADAAQHLVPLPSPVLQRVLDRNRYPVAEQIAATHVPVTVIQGDADTVVPPAQSSAVAAGAGNLYEHLVFPGADHNAAVLLGPVVADAVARLGDHVGG